MMIYNVYPEGDFMSVALAKWGNALGLRLPAYIVKKAALEAGDKVDVNLLENGEIVIKINQPRYSLDHLLEKITKKNLHEASDWDESKGNERW